MRWATGRSGRRETRDQPLASSANGCRSRSFLLIALAPGEVPAIEGPKLFWQKLAVAANQFSVKVDFPSTVVRALNAHHVPVHLASIPIIRLLIGLARRKMKGTGDLFIEKNIAHRLQDVGIEPEREFTDIASARI